MGVCAVTLELPDEIMALLGSPEGAAAKAREALVLELLREARIGQGMAAELLGLTRADVLDLMVERRIPAGPEAAEEADREIERLRRYFVRQSEEMPEEEMPDGRASCGGDQR
jgi:predicted HTH domain antitoxin